MRRLYIPVLLFCAFGYVILTAFLLQAGSVSREINYLVRVAETGLLAIVVVFSIHHWDWKNRGLIPLVVFFVLYGIRLVYDVEVRGIVSEYASPAYVYGYFFGLTLLPVLAIGLLYRPEDGPSFYRQTLYLLAIGNIMLASYALVDGDLSSGTFSGRVHEVGDVEGTAVLNPLAYGMFGAMFAAALASEFVAAEKLTVKLVLLIIAGTAIACANILFGASRGPLLALVIALALLMLRSVRFRPATTGGVLPARMWLLIIALGALVAAIAAKSDGNIFLLDRIESTLEQRSEGREEARDSIFLSAWQDFVSSPVVGSSYLVSDDLAMPHNIFLESLISTGVLGTVVFVLAILRALWGIWRLAGGICSSWGVGLAAITTCMLVAGQTSFSIGQTPELWIFVALVTAISSGESKQTQTSAQANTQTSSSEVTCPA